MVLLAYLLYGRSFSTRPTSVWSTRLEPPERAWRFTLRFLWPRLWRRFAAYRLKPFAVLRKRFAAARLVFNLGIDFTPRCIAPFARCTSHPLRANAPQAPTAFVSVTSSLVQTP